MKTTNKHAVKLKDIYNSPLLTKFQKDQVKDAVKEGYKISFLMVHADRYTPGGHASIDLFNDDIARY